MSSCGRRFKVLNHIGFLLKDKSIKGSATITHFPILADFWCWGLFCSWFGLFRSWFGLFCSRFNLFRSQFGLFRSQFGLFRSRFGLFQWFFCRCLSFICHHQLVALENLSISSVSQLVSLGYALLSDTLLQIERWFLQTYSKIRNLIWCQDHRWRL